MAAVCSAERIVINRPVQQLPLLALEISRLGEIVMSNSKMAFYESLVRLCFLVIFTFAMVAATVGFVSICHMLMQGEVPRLELITRDLS